jgi:hypothetical protein
VPAIEIVVSSNRKLQKWSGDVAIDGELMTESLLWL